MPASPTLNDLLADLADAFPRQAVTPRTVAVYRRELDDLPLDALARAVRQLVRTSDFMPTIAEIRRVTADLALALPSDVEAVQQVEERIRWARNRDDEKRPDVHDAVSEALVVVGGYAVWKAAPNPAILRGQFAKAYRQIVADRLRHAQVEGVAVTPALATARLELPAP